MSPRSKKEYIETIYLCYRNASRSEKVLILNEFCATLGYHRKHTMPVLRGRKRFRKTKTRGPGRASLCPLWVKVFKIYRPKNRQLGL